MQRSWLYQGITGLGHKAKNVPQGSYNIGSLHLGKQHQGHEASTNLWVSRLGLVKVLHLILNLQRHNMSAANADITSRRLLSELDVKPRWHSRAGILSVRHLAPPSGPRSSVSFVP